jgi:hypothetical protein
MRKLLSAVALIILASAANASAQAFTEDFEGGPIPSGWVNDNNSTGAGTNPTWFAGNTSVFPANTGAAYTAANYNATTGNSTISLWLLAPQKNFSNADTLSFFTRTTDGTFPDRMQVRGSTNGASVNCGTLPTDVGDFTNLMLDINSGLTNAGYPVVYTQQTIVLSGFPAGVQNGRFAFRYFVTSGGPSGANSDYIGVDTVAFAITSPVELMNFSVD